MKRFFAIFLAAVLMLGLCACGDGNTTGTDAIQNGAIIAEELQGKWYGPNSEPQLNINADGTGTVILDKETFEATFTAENDVFTAACEGYSISGDYILEGEKLTVTATYGDKEYIVIFTRTPVKLPEDSYIYNYNDETYEINFTEGTITVCEFPPSDRPEIINVYFEYIDVDIYYPHPVPPTETDPNPESPDIPIPEKADTGKQPPEITIDGETVITYESNDDITGTWTTTQDGTVSFFGITNDTTVPITYTFNADGTGTILAMGIIPGTMTYSVEDGVLNLTVSMLGDTESGTGYVKRVGDTLYVQNLKGEVQALTRQG